MLTRKYKPGKFDGGILLFRARENQSSFKYLGWETIVKNIKMFEIDADHWSIKCQKKNVELIFKEIKKFLANVNKF